MSRDDDVVVFEHERDQVTVGNLREWHYLEVTCRCMRSYRQGLSVHTLEALLYGHAGC